MTITQLKLLNFRNYEKIELSFHPNYNIIYEESSDEENTVIKQSVSKNTKITKDKVITLTISKTKEDNEDEDVTDDDLEQ